MINSNKLIKAIYDNMDDISRGLQFLISTTPLTTLIRIKQNGDNTVISRFLPAPASAAPGASPWTMPRGRRRHTPNTAGGRGAASQSTLQGHRWGGGYGRREARVAAEVPATRPIRRKLERVQAEMTYAPSWVGSEAPSSTGRGGRSGLSGIRSRGRGRRRRRGGGRYDARQGQWCAG